MKRRARSDAELRASSGPRSPTLRGAVARLRRCVERGSDVLDVFRPFEVEYLCRICALLDELGACGDDDDDDYEEEDE